MTKPITIVEARARGLLTKADGGIHTFSNGSSHDCWADANCYECWHYDPDQAGALCAFEAAAFLSIASPDLARMFGWLRREGNTQDGERFGWTPPRQCAYFRRRKNDDGSDNPPPPDPDPLQLVLIADPTEDARVFHEKSAAVSSPRELATR